MNSNPLFEAILNGDAEAARCITEQALAAGADPLSLVNQSMVPAMEETGKRFTSGEFFVPDLLIRARAMKTAMVLIRPLLGSGGIRSLGRVVIGTVKGDVHDIGKNLVGSMLEGSGFEVTDLGVNVGPEKFIEAIAQLNPQIIGLSALLTTTMLGMKATVEALEQAGLRKKVKVLIGGAPITRRFTDEIGADGFSNNAVGAVVLAKLSLGIPAESADGVYISER
jgi:5-methyltetrahydrofolate--homocysteine methyltransferase